MNGSDKTSLLQDRDNIMACTICLHYQNKERSRTMVSMFGNAVENGDDDLVMHFLDDHTVDINQPCCLGWYPLHLAALQGHSSTLNLLIAQGACLTTLNSMDENVLHVALHMGQNKKYENIVRDLLRFGLHAANPKERLSLWTPDRNGMTPLMQAVFGSSTSVVKLLLDNGADVSDMDFMGQNCLHHLASRRLGSNMMKKKICEMLLSHDQNVYECLDLLTAETEYVVPDEDDDSDDDGGVPPLTPYDCALIHGNPEIAAILKSMETQKILQIKELTTARQARIDAVTRSKNLAFAMGQHARLGQLSHVTALGPDLLQKILSQAHE